MPNPEIKKILAAIEDQANTPSNLKANLQDVCQNCGHPIDIPNRADTDLPNPNGESSYDK